MRGRFTCCNTLISGDPEFLMGLLGWTRNVLDAVEEELLWFQAYLLCPPQFRLEENPFKRKWDDDAGFRDSQEFPSFFSQIMVSAPVGICQDATTTQGHITSQQQDEKDALAYDA
ncbi:hypothetical protein APHAL10511_004015 [Amanita phalloides]|nr:hypothetical protein APHAL10511_004015 [Amanita phalloides]